MGIDLIKSYLVGIGFRIDSSSFEQANSSMDGTKKKVEEFNKNSKKGFSETGNSLKGLFSLLDSKTLKNLFPWLDEFKELSNLKSIEIDKLFPGINELKDLPTHLKSVKESDLFPGIDSALKKGAEYLRLFEQAQDKLKPGITMKESEKAVDEFNEASKKGFSESKKSFSDLIAIMDSLSLKDAFPELDKSLKKGSKYIEMFRKAKEGLSESASKSESNKTANSKGNSENKTSEKSGVKSEIDGYKELFKFLKGFKEKTLGINDKFSATAELATKKIGGLKNGIGGLIKKGGPALKGFSITAIASIAAIVAVVLALIVAIKKVGEYLNKLANEDIEYEKLSRQLWTTKDTAKEVSQALDLLGASMEDLWLSPTLLKQFNQLRQDSSQLRLPPEFSENLKLVQGLGLEFKRFQQLLSMLFQWIGHYILEYLAGPLAEVKGDMGDLNGWLIQNIPKVAKVIGTLIGGFLRLVFVVGKVIWMFWKVISPVFKFLKLIGSVFDIIDKAPDRVKKTANLIVGYIIAMTAPFLLVIAVIDDFLTYLRGGESVIGDIIDGFSGDGSEAIDKIKQKFELLKIVFGLGISFFRDKWQSFGGEGSDSIGGILEGFYELKETFADGMSYITGEWDDYWERASEALDKIEDKAREVWGKVREWSKNKLDEGKEFFGEFGEKVVSFADDYGNGSRGVESKSYLTNSSNTSHNTTNSNSVSNANTINVYGTEAESTSRAIDRRLQGITVRNMQGVLE